MRSCRPPSQLWTILVVVAMLWSQAVYALHGGCLSGPGPTAMAHATMGGSGTGAVHALDRTHDGVCNGGISRQRDPACAFHCADPAGSSDVTRIPPLPAVLPEAAPLFKRVVRLDAAVVALPRDYEAPRVRPRGPTGHPAPLLLI
jgi:hypothetical protein